MATDLAPRRVFLFSGHMIDSPERPQPRFPVQEVHTAERAIANTLDALGAAPGDLAICGGACGGDLLFAQAALERGLALEVRIPFEEPEFLAASVDFAGSDWRARYDDVKRHPATRLHVLPAELGPDPETDPYERQNCWLLDSALRFGPERLEFICLWDGGGGDGPGGTRHLVHEVERHRARVHWLDTRELWSFRKP
ncbi:MAG: hypothetical protein WCA12_20665 [Burkholderiales bacterium]